MFLKQALTSTALVLWTAAAGAQDTGRIEGHLLGEDARGIGGATVIVDELCKEQLEWCRGRTTDNGGAFSFERVPSGSYTLFFTLDEFSDSETGVAVGADSTTTVTKTVGWDLGFADTITVYSAARRRERIVEAPGAMTAVTPEEIAARTGPGQVPKLLEFTVGAELTQSGLYDFNFNVRGFNNFTTRRVQTFIDGRDTASPLVSHQEWVMMTNLIEDLESMELVRGPSAALYGSNAFSGVLNMVTKQPRDSQGGTLRFTTGELNTLKLDVRWAGSLGNDWYAKLMAGHNESDDFSRSRHQEVEYAGLSFEALPLPPEKTKLDSASFRFDKHFADGQLFTVEGGSSDIDHFTLLLAFGRGHAFNFRRDWARINHNSLHWNLLGYYNTRESDNQILLNSGGAASTHDYNFQFELQGNSAVAGGRGRIIGGASYGEVHIDSANPQGIQTVVAAPIASDRQALFGQFDFDLTKKLKLVTALRLDDSFLHDRQVSPKGSLVYQVAPHQSLRIGYNEGFQVGNFQEYFLAIPAGAPIDLSAVEVQIAPLLNGVPLGLGFIPVLGLGNRDLLLEEVKSFELGYRGILGSKTFLNIDYYSNRMKDFITDLGPRANPNIPPYMAPAALPPTSAAFVEALLNGILPGLTNDPETGGPLFALSYGNTGKVNSQGVEVALSHDIGSGWIFDFNYSWFDFEIKEQRPFTEVHPNGPEHQASAGVTMSRDRLRAALHFRWVDDFAWASGIFVGPVPAYEVVNLSASYDLSDRWELGLLVDNAFDDRHYEAFGGSLMERRALVSAALRW